MADSTPKKEGDKDKKGIHRTSNIEKYYQLGKEIGRGSYATVRECVHIKSKKTYAIKIIQKRLLASSKFLDREIAIMKQTKHPYIIRMREVFEDEKNIYLVMTMVNGGDLFDKIVEKEVFTERDASIIIGQVLDAVKYLHETGIVHRDLKVDNILCAEENGEFHCYVADFGLSRFFTSEQFLLESRVGSLEYTAPEVFASSPYEKSCDLWSIGIITYILLTGLFPFAHKNPMRLYEKINNVDYNWDECPPVSDSVKDFIAKLLVKDPKKRMTAEDALQHPWIKQEGNVKETMSSENTSERMKSFKKNEKTRKESKNIDTIPEFMLPKKEQPQ